MIFEPQFNGYFNFLQKKKKKIQRRPLKNWEKEMLESEEKFFDNLKYHFKGDEEGICLDGEFIIEEIKGNDNLLTEYKEIYNTVKYEDNY